MKTLKIQRAWTGILLSTALLLTAACSSEQELTVDNAPQGKKITLNASLTKTGAQTRMAFEDVGEEGIKTTWSEGDAVRVYNINMNTSTVFTLVGTGGGTEGVFEGTLPEGDTGNRYMVAYPASKMPVEVNGHIFLSLLGQVQTGNGDMKHLSDYNYIAAIISNWEETVFFEPNISILTFDLTLPSDYDASKDGAPVKLNVTGNFCAGTANEIGGTIDAVSMELKDIKMQADRKLTAYMAFSSDIDPENEIQVNLFTANGKIYSFKRAVTQGMYHLGCRYTANIGASDWDDTTAQTLTDDTQAATAFATGSGDGSSETTPYLISNAAEMKYFIEQVNKGTSNGGTNYSGKYIKLTTDIYVTMDVWTPIGNSSSHAFKGTFDGGEHTIFGKLHAQTEVQSAESGAVCFGFFGLTYDATIKNLNMNADVKGGTTNDGYYYTGSIAGYGDNNLTVTNCHNYGKVTVGETTSSGGHLTYTGGIAGTCKTITGCGNHGEVVGGKGINGSDTGGIAGSCMTSGNTITNCENYGKITAGITTGYYSNTGGIAGSSYALSGCTNYGEVTSPDTEAGFILGGIIGVLSDDMHACLNVGTIKKAQGKGYMTFAGGLTGYGAAPLYDCNTHAGIVLEADSTPTADNPKVGEKDSRYSEQECTEGHTAP